MTGDFAPHDGAWARGPTQPRAPGAARALPASGRRTPSTEYAPAPAAARCCRWAEAEYERLFRTCGWAQLTKYVGFGSLYVRSAWPPSRSEYWSPKLAMIS